ncbi:MAG: phenylalanine--tRNA ligase subunit beta [Candidatus Pacebacteria bacterium]|nr:phenylalanine--tRNA ligase subunit beta [Candidatus Paceibacterota bacterium]
MLFSYNWLKSFFSGELPEPKKLAEILTLHSFEVESLEKKGTDWILGIDVLPDRAGDCLSHIGIAREISVLLNKKLILPKVKINTKGKGSISVEVADSKDCLRYIACAMDNVKIGSSPKWLKEKLEACGLNSINNVVDATNYVMLETGQPLHAFDFNNVSGGHIVVRRAKKGEKIMTLSEKEYILNENILVIADSNMPMALAGIKGGKIAEISNKTTKIILESANFNAKLISQTARKLNLRTDASVRFENNIDPNLAEIALNRVISMIEEIANGKVVSKISDVYKSKAKTRKIVLEIKEVSRIIGIEIPKKDIINILVKLGFGVKETKSKLLVEVPTYRQDIIIPENLIEEIGRIFGYEKVVEELPRGYLEPIKRNESTYWQNKARDILKELKFTEIYMYSFIGDEEKNVFQLKAEEIVNPVSAFYNYLRPTLIPQMAKTIKENLKFFKDIAVFEIGKSFTKDKETFTLSGGVSCCDFYCLKACLNTLFDKLGVKNVSYSLIKDKSFWNKGKTADIIVKGEKIGNIGYLSMDICQVLGLNKNVVYFEINFEKLEKNCSRKKTYEAISYHPPALRDISGIISDEVSVDDIIDLIKKKGGQLLKSAEVFDVYKGNGIPQGKKSVSFHLVYQSEEKTLDSKTVDSLRDGLVNELNQGVNWEERK